MELFVGQQVDEYEGAVTEYYQDGFFRVQEAHLEYYLIN